MSNEPTDRDVEALDPEVMAQHGLFVRRANEQAEPPVFRIVTPNGEPLLSIHADGRWEFRDDAAPTEAAGVFVREVKALTERRGGPTDLDPAYFDIEVCSCPTPGTAELAVTQALATAGRQAAGEALLESARFFEYEMADAWGRDVQWVSTGSHVADLVAGILRDHAATLLEVRRCRRCGCTDDHACTPPCSWVEPDLCSRCVV